VPGETEEPKVAKNMTLNYQDASVYKGAALDGLRHGYGRMSREHNHSLDDAETEETDAKSDQHLSYSYEGQWNNDKMGNGPGELKIWEVDKTLGLGLGGNLMQISSNG